MNKTNFSTPLALPNIHISDPFWKRNIELVRKEVIPYQWDLLNDRIKDAPASFCMRNFKLAGKLTASRKSFGYADTVFPVDTFEPLPEDRNHMEDRFYGFLFQDSDFYKWVEAVSYSLIHHPDKELEAIADDAIDVVCSAAQENGYLDTFFIINDLSKAFTNLRDQHELYCFGHLIEGAVAYYQATGKDKLLHAVTKYADYIVTKFGPEEGKLHGYPGHELAELALVRLYEVTGEQRYLTLSKYFIDERGRRPYYFDLEVGLSRSPLDDGSCYEYSQSHLPVRQQKEAVGHAVRAVYLYSGMADVAKRTNDDSLFAACERLWDNITNQKMYLTGGIGATHLGEAFSYNYDLPNDTAYAETCASIGLVFFARRMLEMKADRKYSDVMERALYNGILSGMALDGKSFFYVNPLEVIPEACRKDARKTHVKPVRQKWFGCACCPPNIARMVSSIGSYAYTHSSDTLYVHLYVAGSVDLSCSEGSIHLATESNLPWDKDASFTIHTDKPLTYTIALRIPSWTDGYELSGLQDTNQIIKDGYLYLTKTWNKTERFHLQFNLHPCFLRSHQKVRENVRKVALVRGPLVYCLEEIDNSKDLHLIRIPEKITYSEVTTKEFGSDVITLETNGLREKVCPGDSLYSVYGRPEYEEVRLRWIPYYTWANRGEGEMKVWVDSL